MPHRLLALWEAEDVRAGGMACGSVWEEAESRVHLEELAREVGLEAEARESARPAVPAPKTPPGAADDSAVFKAKPSEAQFAAYAAMAHPGGPPPKPPPMGWAWRADAQQPAGASAAGSSAELAAPKPPPPKPPPGSPRSDAGVGAALPGTLPPWLRSQLEATVAAGEAAARALAIADAGGVPAFLPPAPSPAPVRPAAAQRPAIRGSAGAVETGPAIPIGAGKNGAGWATG